MQLQQALVLAKIYGNQERCEIYRSKPVADLIGLLARSSLARRFFSCGMITDIVSRFVIRAGAWEAHVTLSPQ